MGHDYPRLRHNWRYDRENQMCIRDRYFTVHISFSAAHNKNRPGAIERMRKLKIQGYFYDPQQKR